MKLNRSAKRIWNGSAVSGDMTSTDSAKRHVPELQSLRGIAAMMVLFGHSTAVYNSSESLITLEKILFNGHASVVFFFVLSGYVLFHMLSGRALTPREVAGYYARRLLRIYPALWLASMVALVYVVLFRYNIAITGASDWFLDRFKEERFNIFGIAASMAGVLAFLLPQVWSVAIEVFASFVIPGMVAIVRKRGRIAYYVLGLMLVLASFTVGPTTPYSVLTYLLSFWIGGAIYTMSASFREAVMKVLRPLWLFLGVAVLAVVCTTRFWGLPDPAICLAEGVASAVLILLVTDQALDFRALRSKWLASLGDWSYSIYLLHFPVMCLITVLFQVSFVARLSNDLKSCALALCTALVTIPASLLVYECIERPGNELGRRIAQVISGRRDSLREATVQSLP